MILLQEMIDSINEEMLNTHKGLFSHNAQSFINHYDKYDDLQADIKVKEDFEKATHTLALLWSVFFRIKVLEGMQPTKITDTYYRHFGSLIRLLNTETETLINCI